MKLKKSNILLTALAFSFQFGLAQSPATPLNMKEFTNLNEALQDTAHVFRLNLSNQNISFPNTIWSKFPNLQYLSLKNVHLKNVPEGIGSLKNLTVLDLSGNDFEIFPANFIQLVNLHELYLNDDKNLKLEQGIEILSQLPQLHSLHIESDELKTLPKNISKLSHLDSLYLNNNKFVKIPSEILGLKNLKFLDLHDNKISVPNPNKIEHDFSVKIRF
jgi:Leucine-rich repeat (LRR) protein